MDDYSISHAKRRGLLYYTKYDSAINSATASLTPFALRTIPYSVSYY